MVFRLICSKIKIFKILLVSMSTILGFDFGLKFSYDGGIIERNYQNGGIIEMEELSKSSVRSNPDISRQNLSKLTDRMKLTVSQQFVHTRI